MPFAAIGGEEIYYAARGRAGAPLVFLHGAGSSHLVWNGQLAALADSARAVAPDLPGHGRSPGTGRTSVREYAQLTCGLFDALALKRVILVGHSMGGAIAQTLALDYPERVLGLGLLGTGARLRVQPAFLQSVLDDFAAAAPLITATEFAPNAAANLMRLSERQLLRCAPQVVHDDFAACDAFDVMGRVAEIRVPTLVLVGSEDRMTPVKYSRFLADKIAGARLEIIDGAGHMLMLEQPAHVNRLLQDWLRSFPQA